MDVLKEEESKLAESAKLGAIVVFSEDIADKWADTQNIVVRAEGSKETKRHKVTGTEHCDKGLKDSHRLQIKKGLTA